MSNHRGVNIGSARLVKRPTDEDDGRRLPKTGAFLSNWGVAEPFALLRLPFNRP
jgi:hypothetical protein